MRDRLIELICENIQTDECVAHCNHPYCDKCKNLADYLLANGVIVPPCKVGSKIYILVTKRAKVNLPPFTFIKVSRLTFYNLERVLQDFGKTVFLTREEAEAKLKGGEEG